MRLTFTIEFHRNEPEPWHETDMTPAQVELGPPTIGFAAPMHETGYENRNGNK